MSFCCSTCQMSLNSDGQLQQHYNGKAHAKKLQDKGMPAYVPPPPPQLLPGYGGHFVSQGTMGTVSQGAMGTGSHGAMGTGSHGAMGTVSQGAMGTISQGAMGTVLHGAMGTIQQPPPPPPPAPPVAYVPRANPVSQAVVANALGKLPLKRKPFDGRCAMCGITFNSETQASQHFTGSKHAKRIKQATNGEEQTPEAITAAINEGCRNCGVLFNSPSQADQHYTSAKHMKKLSEAGGYTGDTATSLSAAVTGSIFHCPYCNAHVNSLQQLEAHQLGSKHQAKVKSLEQRGTAVDETPVVITPVSDVSNTVTVS